MKCMRSIYFWVLSAAGSECVFVRVQYSDYFGELMRIELIYTLSLIPRSTLACDEYIFIDADVQN